MAVYSATPGRLNLTLRAADDFSALIDFSISLTGAAFAATISSVVTGAAIGSFTCTLTDAAAGKVNISMTDTATAALATGTYRWTLVGTTGTLQRTYLEGFVEVTR